MSPLWWNVGTTPASSVPAKSHALLQQFQICVLPNVRSEMSRTRIETRTGNVAPCLQCCEAQRAMCPVFSRPHSSGPCTQEQEAHSAHYGAIFLFIKRTF